MKEWHVWTGNSDTAEKIGKIYGIWQIKSSIALDI